MRKKIITENEQTNTIFNIRLDSHVLCDYDLYNKIKNALNNSSVTLDQIKKLIEDNENTKHRFALFKAQRIAFYKYNTELNDDQKLEMLSKTFNAQQFLYGLYRKYITVAIVPSVIDNYNDRKKLNYFMRTFFEQNDSDTNEKIEKTNSTPNTKRAIEQLHKELEIDIQKELEKQQLPNVKNSLDDNAENANCEQYKKHLIRILGRKRNNIARFDNIAREQKYEKTEILVDLMRTGNIKSYTKQKFDDALKNLNSNDDIFKYIF